MLRKKFDVENNWFRFEWQSRDNNHIHEFLWIRDASDVEQLAEYLEFWNVIIIVINSDDDLFFATMHLFNRLYSEQINTLKQLTKFLNRMQHHKCMIQYYQRRDKVIKEIWCRFVFSWSEQKNSIIKNHSNLIYKTFQSARNDSQLSKYQITLNFAWLTNIDFVFYINKNSVIHYLVKYMFKKKKRFERLVDINKHVLQYLFENNLMFIFIIWIYNNTIAERDWFV